MQQTRRSFALTAASGGAAVLAAEAFGQSPNSWQSQLNPLIVADLKGTATQALQGYAAGRVKAGDVLVLAHSFGLWSQHVHQIGAEGAAAAELAHAFDAPLSSTNLERVRQIVLPVASGPRIEAALGKLAGANTPATMAAVKAGIASGGLWGMHQTIVGGLNTVGNRLQQTGGIGLASAGELPGGARLVRVQDTSWDACAFLAGLAIYLATWGFMGEIGAISIGILSGGTAFALLGLILAAAGAIFCV
jgi:hypothetical protein